MSENPERAGKPGDESGADLTPLQARRNRAQRRREKIVAEIERNRRGGHTVPTWVLTTLLIVLVVGLTLLIVFGGS